MQLARNTVVIVCALLICACSVESDESASAINWDNMDFVSAHCSHSQDPSCNNGKVVTDRIIGSRGK